MDHRHGHGHIHGQHHEGHVGSTSHKHVNKGPAQTMTNDTVIATTERFIATTKNMSVNGGHVSMDGGHVSMDGGQVSENSGHVLMDGGHLSMDGGNVSMHGSHVSEHGDHVSEHGGHVVYGGNHTMDDHHGHGYDHDGAHTGHSSHMMMSHTHKYFSTGSFLDLLIKGINVSSMQDLILTLLVVMCLVILIEALNTWLKRHGQRSQYSSVTSKLTMLLLATVVKMATLTFGYLAMLLVMTMNYWILVAAVLGSGLGYLIMRPIIAACCSPQHRASFGNQSADELRVSCSAAERMSCKPLCEAAQSDAMEVPKGEEETTPLTWSPQLDKPCSQT